MASLNKLTAEKKDLSVTETHVDNIAIGIAPADVNTYAEGRFVSNLPSKFFITNTQSVPVDAMADYVVEAGRITGDASAPGIWYYRKWAKGLMEVWMWANPTKLNSISSLIEVNNTSRTAVNTAAKGNYYLRMPLIHNQSTITQFPDKILFTEKPRCFFLGGCLGDPYNDTELTERATLSRHTYTSASIAGWTQDSPGASIAFIKPSNRVLQTNYKYEDFYTKNDDRPVWYNLMYRGKWK